MFERVWEIIKAVFGPIIFAVRALCSVWSGFSRMARLVMGFVQSVVAPVLALWQGSKTFITKGTDGQISISTKHMATDGKVYVKNDVMSEEEFEEFDFVESSEQSQGIFDKVKNIIDGGDTAAIKFQK